MMAPGWYRGAAVVRVQVLDEGCPGGAQGMAQAPASRGA